MVTIDATEGPEGGGVLRRPLLTKREIAEWLNCTPRHINRLVALGRLPQPIRFGYRFVRWLPNEVEACLERR